MTKYCELCKCFTKKHTDLYKWTLVYTKSEFLGIDEGMKQVWFCPGCISDIREASNIEGILLGENND